MPNKPFRVRCFSLSLSQPGRVKIRRGGDCRAKKVSNGSGCLVITLVIATKEENSNDQSYVNPVRANSSRTALYCGFTCRTAIARRISSPFTAAAENAPQAKRSKSAKTHQSRAFSHREDRSFERRDHPALLEQEDATCLARVFREGAPSATRPSVSPGRRTSNFPAIKALPLFPALLRRKSSPRGRYAHLLATDALAFSADTA